MWVIIILASLVGLLILALCVPLDMVLHTDVYGKPKFRLRLSWLFGLVSKELPGEKKKPEEKRRVAKGKKKRSWRDARFAFGIFRTEGLLRQIKELVKDVFTCLKFRDLVADFRIGLGDPADTGLLFAFIGPATLFLGSSRFHQIRLEPSFSDEAVLEGYTHGMVRLWPIQLVLPFLKFTFSPATIRTVKTLILTKWKRKN